MKSFKKRFKMLSKNELEECQFDFDVLFDNYLKNLVGSDTVSILNRNYSKILLLRNHDKPLIKKLRKDLKQLILNSGFIIKNNTIYKDNNNPLHFIIESTDDLLKVINEYNELVEIKNDVDSQNNL